jgi:hypothetical protein
MRTTASRQKGPFDNRSLHESGHDAQAENDYPAFPHFLKLLSNRYPLPVDRA